jgi:hypothetical protein
MSALYLQPRPSWGERGLDDLAVFLARGDLSGLSKTSPASHHVDNGGNAQGGPTGMRGAVSTSSVGYSKVARWLSTFRTYSSRLNS